MTVMIKKLLVVLIFITVALGVVGCSTKSNMNFKDIDEKVEKATDVSNMRAEDKEKLKKLYDIDANKLEDFKFYRAESNVKADELLILKVKDKKDIDDIKNKINKRIEKQETSFKDYLPKEYDLIKNSVVKTKEEFVLFIASSDADKVAGAFN